jgi:hypothetical protein
MHLTPLSRRAFASALSGCLAGLFVLVVAPPARALPALRQDLAELAKGVKKLLDEERQTSVGVGQFTAPPHLGAGAGPGLALVFQEELRKLGVRIERRSLLGVEGRYRDTTDRRTGQLSALLQVQVKDNKDTVLVNLSRRIADNAVIAQLFGVSAPLKPGAGTRANNRQVQARLRKPQVAISLGRVSPTRSSPFAVEVLVGGRGLPARQEDGEAFVRLRRGQEYAVRLVNRSKQEAAVELTIDGLSMFAFSEVKDPKTGAPRYRHVLVPPGESRVVVGWHRNNKVSDAFLITAYSRSAVAKLLPNSSKVGVITATFAVTTPPAKPKPAPAELEKKEVEGDAESADEEGDATGRGREVPSRVTERKRTIGPVQAVISVRYTR